MGKVKQALQEVEEEVVSLVSKGKKLVEIKFTLSHGFKRFDNPYMLDEKLVKTCFNKAVWERDNEEEYHETE